MFRDPHLPPAGRERAPVRLGSLCALVVEVDKAAFEKRACEAGRAAEGCDRPDVLERGKGERGEVGPAARDHEVAEDRVRFEALYAEG